MNGVLLSYPLLRPRYWTDALEIGTPKAERRFQAMSFILEEIQRVARDNGSLVGFIFVPSRWQYEEAAHDLDHPMVKAGMVRRPWIGVRTEVQRRLERWADAHGVPLLDLTEVLTEAVKRGRPINYEFDGHWKPAGHVVAALAILKWVEVEFSEALLPK